ncbi:uridine kinase [Fistulifera solaris]|uniref:uracil phosphoribosyltransferase n=1 Tax=Fistulifera solaris TaxID=1519565 RepID=A0A1Z5KRY8_FISSO|nr:uridine kinase [Fistulifera solaris]|eukprot:GAX29083.1 uridine kinase [Fistulifera solaris]
MSSGLHPNLTLVQSKALRLLFTKLRDKNTSQVDFVQYSKRLMRLLVEDTLASLPTVEIERQTPTGLFKGLESTTIPSQTCVVSIMRSGDALLESFREVEPAFKVGKILIQRDEASADKTAQFFYEKLPPGIHEMNVILCDPMVATAGSAIAALDLLCQVKHVDPSQITFATIICAPEGLGVLARKYPEVKIVTAAIDESLNDEKFIVPGLGDFGDRFYGT